MYPKLPYLTENGIVAQANLIDVSPSLSGGELPAHNPNHSIYIISHILEKTILVNLH